MPGTDPQDTDTLQDPALARSLLRAVAADPRHLPEHLAAFAVRHTGPSAARSVDRVGEAHPDAAMAELRARVLVRGRRRVVTEGAFVGGPLVILMPFAFCAALLSQARTCLELAAIDGRDPTDLVRGAELLVLQGVYEDVDRARAALSELALPGEGGTAEGPKQGAIGRLRRRAATLWGIILRMARLLGLIAPRGEPTKGRAARWLAQAGRYALLGAVLLVGMVAPLVWLPYLGLSYGRATDRLMDRATTFYFGEPAPARPRRATRLEPEMVVAALRAVLSLLVPLGLIFAVLLADPRLAGSNWPVLGIALTAASFAVAAVWQWRRHRRRRTA
ncbi:hypothetical protein [Streptomyces sp. SAJ15]|uniref:hypothetical protein n=1 Tax=Streptomyces sp. SAJ15 TaxID=2011095 RepID=UPI0011872C98|nr:hypothetical protein [Streptomyces sp. SAJ15]TVL92992.1 hypothetical protein CD790_07620 [Streptomyces sp. SAJ15]